jgi:heme A synthase
LIGLAVVATVLVTALRRPAAQAVRRLAIGAAAIIAVQILLGGAYVLTRGNPWLSAAHLGTAALLWAFLLAIALLARKPAEGAWEPTSVHLGPRAPSSTAEAMLR